MYAQNAPHSPNHLAAADTHDPHKGIAMTILITSETAPTLGLACIAANKSDMTVFAPQDAKTLRTEIAKFAPKAHFYVCYYHQDRRAWYRIYDSETNRPKVFTSPFLTIKEAQTLWTKVKALSLQEARQKDEIRKKQEAKILDFPVPVA